MPQPPPFCGFPPWPSCPPEPPQPAASTEDQHANHLRHAAAVAEWWEGLSPEHKDVVRGWNAQPEPEA